MRHLFRSWLDGYDCLIQPLEDPTGPKVLLRPAVLYGEPALGCPILMGYNPSRRFTAATLTQANLTEEAYKDKLACGEAFERFYAAQTGKPLYVPGTPPGRDSHSRIQYLIDRLRRRYGGVLLTNYYAYPAGTKEEMDEILQKAAAPSRFRKHESHFARIISQHVCHLLRLVNPVMFICMGDDARLLGGRLVRETVDLRHPSWMADPNSRYPNRLTWEQAVASVCGD